MNKLFQIIKDGGVGHFTLRVMASDMQAQQWGNMPFTGVMLICGDNGAIRL